MKDKPSAAQKSVQPEAVIGKDSSRTTAQEETARDKTTQADQLNRNLAVQGNDAGSPQAQDEDAVKAPTRDQQTQPFQPTQDFHLGKSDRPSASSVDDAPQAPFAPGAVPTKVAGQPKIDLSPSAAADAADANDTPSSAVDGDRALERMPKHERGQ